MAAVFCALAFSGCYTKLAYYQGETAPYAERSEESLEERALSQTREVCVWERDMFGFAHLRCYNSNYSSSWLYFHNTPWWYRNQYRWYETRGCPPYYYYDRGSGSCRYYGALRPGRPGHPPGGGGSASSGTSRGGIRGSQRDLPAGSETSNQSHGSSVPMFPTSSTKQLSPVGAPVNTPSSSSNDALSKGGHENKNETPPPPQVTSPPEQKPPSQVTPPSGQRQRSQEENQQDTPSRRPQRGR